MAEETTVKVEELGEMSQEQLEMLEDTIVAESGEAQGYDDKPADPPAKPAEKPADPPADPADPPLPVKADGDDPDPDEPELPPIKADDPAAPAGDPDPAPATADQIRQNISPPSKWAKMRHEQNDLKGQLAEAQAKAEKADVLEGQLTKIQKEMDWMKSALTSRNVEIPGDPLDMFTDDRLKEVQDEFGSEVADLFRATKAALGGSTPAQGTPDPQPGAEPAKADPAAQPAQPPAGDQPEDPEVAKVVEAIFANNDLTYWSEEKPELFTRATAIDAAWLKHPQYLSLSYDDRFKLVVKQVQDEEIAKGIKAAEIQGGDANPDVPASLSGSGGQPQSQAGMSPYERMMAAPTDDKRVEIYNSLPEADKDQVDIQLGI